MNTRKAFIKSIVRAGLWLLLGLIVFTVGNRVVTGRDCSACPGRTSCNGVSECNRK